MSHCGMNTLPTELSHSLFETRVAGNYADCNHIFHFLWRCSPKRTSAHETVVKAGLTNYVHQVLLPQICFRFFTSVFVGFYHVCNNTQCKGRLHYVIYWLE